MAWILEIGSTVLFWVLAIPTMIGFVLFLASGITIFVWLGAWKAFVFSGTSITGLLVACAYLWASVAWGEPYLRWYLGLIGRS
jgi:hypothetical protein